MTASADVRVRVLGMALIQLGQHMRAHGLGEPFDIVLPHPGRDHPGLAIHVPACTADAWTRSLTGVGDTHIEEKFGPDARWLKHTVDGLLPDSGVQVRIYWLTPPLVVAS